MSLSALKEQILLCPQSADGYLALSNYYITERRVFGECRSTELACAAEPQNVLAHVLYGQALMRSGDYKRGLDYFDRRIELSPGNGSYLHGLKRYSFNHPADLDISRILVLSEMGRGDMIQFARYLPLLSSENSLVCAIVPPDLVQLFSSSQLCDFVTNEIDDIHPLKDSWLPMGDLLQLFGASQSSPLLSHRYLSAPIEYCNSWHRRIAVDKAPDCPLIVINWAAQRWQHECGSLSARHLPIECLSALEAIPKAMFCSVQKGPSQKLWQTLPFADRFLSSQFLIDMEHDFASTAAILELADFCLTVDTSVAHLAGGLGVNTFILLNSSCCWRWGDAPSGPSPSGWYDSATLLRNNQPGDWAESISWFVNHVSFLISNS